jgi:hypothetical protein
MNSYYSTFGQADGTFQEIFLWAESLAEAESLVIYNLVPAYFKQKDKVSTNLYSKIERKRSKQKSEFVLSIHDDLTDFSQHPVFFVTVRKYKGINLYAKKIIYS